MEKEIVWTAAAQKDFWEIVVYLKDSWSEKVLQHFHSSLLLKSKILLKQMKGVKLYIV